MTGRKGRGPRQKRVARLATTAGCYVCGGGDIQWEGGNAQGVAARHHDATGHQTWVGVVWSIVYGDVGDAVRGMTR